MKSMFSRLYAFLAAFCLMACQNNDVVANTPVENNTPVPEASNTLIVYYSYTHNTEQIVDDLKSLITADVIQVQPAEKNLDYAANNYAIGSAQLTKIKDNPDDAGSYPAIDPVDVDLSRYDTIIIATPLWWSQMASNLQTFLFTHGREMAGKKIGLIVSSHSSGISGVEADAHRLVPEGRFLSKSLWINAAKHSQRKSLLQQWLKERLWN